MDISASKKATKTEPKLWLNKHNGVFIILAILLIIAGLYSPNFISLNNLMTMLRQASALGILTIGQLFVIVGGGVDLSVAATMQMGITIFMYGYNNFGIPGLVIGVAGALLFGVLAGLANGILVTKYHVQPFLTTLFTGSIITGMRMIFAGIKPAGNIPDVIRFFGRDRTYGIPNALIIFMLVSIITYFVLQKSVYGRKLIAVGTNYMAARFSAIKADLILIYSYVICSVLAILASIVLAGYVGFADQWIGAGYSFNSLIAAVIGGNYLGGGRGSVTGVIGGALTMTIVINFVTLLGLSAPFQHVVSGIVLILALFIGIASGRK
jgi:ribose/xylose/arabinose/galactoside ABC-type transport system permease subunit